MDGRASDHTSRHSHDLDLAEWVRKLNAPILDPIESPPAGFASKHRFAESDLVSRIGGIKWFHNCGSPLIADLSMPTRELPSWQTAIEAAETIEWENTVLEAQNQLTLWLHRNARNHYQRWNDLVQQHTADLITPLIDECIRPIQEQLSLPKVVISSVQWDILGALMENCYLFLGHPAVFFLELLTIYEAGHFPCGWDGEWPRGTLLVY